MADESKDAASYTTRGTMLEALLTSKVGEGRETTEVAPDTMAMLQLMQGTLITAENMDRLLISPQQVLVTLVNQLAAIPALSRYMGSLVRGVEEPDALAAVRWDTIMQRSTHLEVPKKWAPLTGGLLDRLGNTQLEVAIEECRSQAARDCIDSEHGAFNCAYVQHGGSTALTKALCHNQHWLALRMLDKFGAKGCSAAAIDESGYTALMWACEKGRKDVAMKLLSAGASACKLHNATDNGTTALLLACERGLQDVVVQMLEEHGSEACNATSVGVKGDTALMVSIRNKWAGVAMKLLEGGEGACRPQQVNKGGETALLLACRRKLPTVTQRLLALGPAANQLHHVDNSGDTAESLLLKAVRVSIAHDHKP